MLCSTTFNSDKCAALSTQHTASHAPVAIIVSTTTAYHRYTRWMCRRDSEWESWYQYHSSEKVFSTISSRVLPPLLSTPGDETEAVNSCCIHGWYGERTKPMKTFCCWAVFISEDRGMNQSHSHTARHAMEVQHLPCIACFFTVGFRLDNQWAACSQQPLCNVGYLLIELRHWGHMRGWTLVQGDLRLLLRTNSVIEEVFCGRMCVINFIISAVGMIERWLSNIQTVDKEQFFW